jgi:hypothetical protein
MLSVIKLRVGMMSVIKLSVVRLSVVVPDRHMFQLQKNVSFLYRRKKLVLIKTFKLLGVKIMCHLYTTCVKIWPYDIQHDDIQNNDTRHNDTRHNNIQHDNKENTTNSTTTLCIIAKCGYPELYMLSVANRPFMLRVIMLNVLTPSVMAPKSLAYYKYTCL